MQVAKTKKTRNRRRSPQSRQSSKATKDQFNAGNLYTSHCGRAAQSLWRFIAPRRTDIFRAPCLHDLISAVLDIRLQIARLPMFKRMTTMVNFFALIKSLAIWHVGLLWSVECTRGARTE